MIIPIVFPSAIQFWLNYNPFFGRILNGVFSLVDFPENYEFQVKHDMARQIAEKLNLKFPLSLMCPNKKDKRINNLFYTVQRPRFLPGNSFVEVLTAGSIHILVASPELCFLQAASILDLNRLTILGTDLCGIFLYDENATFRQRSRNPITNVKKIVDYLERSNYLYGKRNALQSARYILDHSNSSVESMLSVMTIFPLFCGGQALKGACLNMPIHQSAEGRKILDGRSCYGDIGWDKEKVVIEYDSNITHLSISQHTLDKKRSSAMIASGYKLFTITSQDLYNLTNLDNIFRSARKALGRCSVDHKLEQYISKREELIQVFKTFRSNNLDTYPGLYGKKYSLE